MKQHTGFPPQIRSVSARLERAMAPIETTFLDAGTGLMEAVTHLGLLTQRFHAVASLLDDSMTLQTLASLERVSTRIAALADGTQASRTRLEGMNGRTDALGQRIDRLRKVMGEVNVLAINAKIEAAHVTARDVDFTVFTREIGRLAQLAGENLDRLADDLSGLRGNMGRALGDLERFNRDHRKSLETVGSRLSQGLAAAAQRRDVAAKAIRCLGDVSSQISGRVALVVEALQIGDMTRQRAEHIREALSTLLDAIDAPALPSGDRLSEEHQAALIGTVCRLQGSQAHHAAMDLGRDLARIDSNIRSLISDLDELPQQAAEAFGGSNGSRSSFLSELGQDFNGVNQLLHVYGSARNRVLEVISNISGVVASMVHHIEDIGSIEGDMRIMGLNATFKCSRLAEQGRTLSIIAQELRGYSNRTAEDGRAIMADLSELVSLANEMGDSERQGQAMDIGKEMDASVTILEAVGAESSSALTELSEAATRAKNTLDRSLQRLSAHPEFIEALKECGGAISTVADTIGDVSSQDLDGIRHEVMDLLHSRYTMSSERKVHDMLSGDFNEIIASEEVSVDDLLF